MHLIEKLRELFNPHSDVATDIEYYCYTCHGMFHSKVHIDGKDWNKLTAICVKCKGKETIIHKVNGTTVRDD